MMENVVKVKVAWIKKYCKLMGHAHYVHCILIHTEKVDRVNLTFVQMDKNSQKLVLVRTVQNIKDLKILKERDVVLINAMVDKNFSEMEVVVIVNPIQEDKEMVNHVV